MNHRDRPGPVDRAERVGLIVLLVFTIIALAGYGIFGRNPALLASLPPSVAGFYGVAFGFFAQAQIVLAGAVLALILWRRAGFRWLGALALVYGVSLLSELGGTRFGVPFGAYAYGELLGPRWFDLVPWLIPLSWFLMAVPSWALARLVVPRGGVVARVLAGALILTVWDLSLDPAMSRVTQYWVWGEEGRYYGMPLVNLAGWYLTGIAIMTGLHALRASDWLDRIPPRLMAGFYGLNLLLPVGMNAAAGLTGAVVVGLAPVLALAILAVGGSRPAAGREGRAGPIEAAPARVVRPRAETSP